VPGPPATLAALVREGKDGMKPKTDRWIRRGAFLLGAILGLWALSGFKIPAGTDLQGADVHVLTASTGELEIPAGVFVRGLGLQPGEQQAVEGSVPVRNRTGVPLDVKVHVLPSITDLNDLLMIEVRAGTDVYRGRLGGLLQWSKRPVRIASGATETFQVSTWLRPGIAGGYQGRFDDVMLAFQGRPAGS
jgi:hypothetical protein